MSEQIYCILVIDECDDDKHVDLCGVCNFSAESRNTANKIDNNLNFIDVLFSDKSKTRNNTNLTPQEVTRLSTFFATHMIPYIT